MNNSKINKTVDRANIKRRLIKYTWINNIGRV